MNRELRLVTRDVPFDDVPHGLNPPTIFPAPADSDATAPGMAPSLRWVAQAARFLALVAAHVGAALGHHFVRRDSVLRAMLPKGRFRR